MGLLAIDPRFMSAVEWTDQMTLLLDKYGDTTSIDDEKDWREWALVANQMPAVAKVNPPDPRTFDDWREWAMLFIQTVDLLPT